MNENFAMDFLTNPKNLYLTKDSRMQYGDINKLLPKDISLFHIEEISFEDNAPRKEALENQGVHFYYGVVKDLSENTKLKLSVNDIGKYILEPSIKGNFRGSKVKSVTPIEKDNILNTIENMKVYSILEGVPGVNKDDEKFQGVDRLVDTMLGDNFGVMIVAKPL